MSLLNTLLWWQWALLAAVPVAMVLLYFLKLKRQPLEVPSTYLWSRTIEDLHVNTIWQRLRRNLLLFLQLLLIVLLAFALLRPGWRGTEMMGDRFVFLIDNSASMSATDRRPTRLEAAKQRALDLVAQMQSGDVAMVIAFSDTAQVVQTYTESRRLLRKQILEIGPTVRATDAREALRAASGLANPGLTRLEDNQAVDEAMPATLYILSDGGFPAVPDFSLGNLEPIYTPFGDPETTNLAVVAFATDRNPEKPDRLQAFTSVGNFGPQAATVQLELFLDNQSLDLVELTVPGGEEAGWHFDLPDVEEGVLKVEIHHDDALPLDNVAFTALNRPRRARVLFVSPGNEPMRLALQTDQLREIAEVTTADPEMLDQQAYQQQAGAGWYDLVIYDRCQPGGMPQANTLFIGSLPPGGKWKASDPEPVPTIIDIDRLHPLTQLVDMNYVKIATGRRLDPPLGSSVLFDSVIGPVFAVGPRDGFEDAVLGFALFDTENGETVPNSSWPLRPSFPVFVYNVVRYLGGSRGSLAVASVAPGDPIPLRCPAHVDQIRIVTPTGQEQQFQRQGQDALVFTGTDRPGVYQVYEGPSSDLAQRFVVNLFSPRESNLVPAPALDLGHETVAGRASVQPTRREVWKWIILAGLCVLGFEWYVYNRRVYL